MYEFAKKEIRDEFKNTEYGRRTNIYVYIFMPIAFIFIALFALSIFDVLVLEDELYNMLLKIISSGLAFISSILACYFDGKRDGAIEQFKRTQKK